MSVRYRVEVRRGKRRWRPSTLGAPFGHELTWPQALDVVRDLRRFGTPNHRIRVRLSVQSPPADVSADRQ